MFVRGSCYSNTRDGKRTFYDVSGKEIISQKDDEIPHLLDSALAGTAVPAEIVLYIDPEFQFPMIGFVDSQRIPIDKVKYPGPTPLTFLNTHPQGLNIDVEKTIEGMKARKVKITDATNKVCTIL